jgi:hypothetical protein
MTDPSPISDRWLTEFTIKLVLLFYLLLLLLHLGSVLLLSSGVLAGLVTALRDWVINCTCGLLNNGDLPRAMKALSNG